VSIFNSEVCRTNCESKCIGAEFVAIGQEVGIPDETLSKIIDGAMDAQNEPSNKHFFGPREVQLEQLRDMHVDVLDRMGGWGEEDLDQLGAAVVGRAEQASGCAAIRESVQLVSVG
jgi:hypothetical protein